MFVTIFIVKLIIVSLCQSFSNAQKNPNFYSNRSAIIHLFEWKWVDIADECERFLQYKGYGGVQISPPNENIVSSGRPWWERYQPVSYNLTTRSGNAAEFGNMVSRCNKVGVRIYVDIVINHMASLTGIGTGGNRAYSNVEIFPAVPYNPEDFHPECNITNYLSPTVVRNCEINNYRDLDQSRQYVRNKILTYLNNLIDLGVAGFRIDSAKYMWPDDLGQIYSELKNLDQQSGFSANTKAFIYQDVPVFDNDVISTEEYTNLGTVIEFKYSAAISRVFRGNDVLANLINWGPDWGFISSSGDALVFVDNHSNQRKEGILNYKNLKQYKMAIAFMLAHNYGIPRIISSYFFTDNDIGPPQDTSENIKSPIIYSDGSCGNGYVCEHRWQQIVNMIDFKNIVAGTNVERWWSNGEQQIAFSRGNSGFVAFTNGGDLIEIIQTSLSSGTYCDIISGGVVNGRCSGRSVTVTSAGIASVAILDSDYDGVLAIHVNSKLKYAVYKIK